MPATSRAETAKIPPGFHPLPSMGDDFNTAAGPIWLAMRDGALRAGLPVEARHCNPAGALHGGMTATLADLYMTLALQFAHDLGPALPVTVSLTVDYLAAARAGEWIEAAAEIDRAGGLSFVRALVTCPSAEGETRLVARASGVFRAVSPRPGQPALHIGNMMRRQFGLAPHPTARQDPAGT